MKWQGLENNYWIGYLCIVHNSSHQGKGVNTFFFGILFGGFSLSPRVGETSILETRAKRVVIVYREFGGEAGRWDWRLWGRQAREGVFLPWK